MSIRHTTHTMMRISLAVCVPVLLGLSGCAGAEAVLSPSHSGAEISNSEAELDVTASVGYGSEHFVHRVDLPERWNGRFMVLFTDQSLRVQSGTIPRRASSAFNDLVATGYVVAEMDALSDPSPNPFDYNRMQVHLVLSMGFPEGTYLVGASLGAEIALFTVVIDNSRHGAEPDVVSPGFVRSGQDRFSEPTVEEFLASDERLATVLAYRLQTDRSELARTLVSYYSLLNELHRNHSGRPYIPGVLFRDSRINTGVKR